MTASTKSDKLLVGCLMQFFIGLVLNLFLWSLGSLLFVYILLE